MKKWLGIPMLLLASAAGASEDLGEFMMHHIGNGYAWRAPWGGPVFHLPDHWKMGGLDLSISLHVLTMLLGAVLLVALLIPAARRKGLAPIGRWGTLIEVIVVFVRDEVVKPNLGEENTKKWLPFFLTLFFFILILNLIPLIPGVPGATGNINVTAALAVMTFVVFNVAGMVRSGPLGYFSFMFPKGMPWPIYILIAPIELMGIFTKAFALCIRLFANMTADHVLILSLLGLIVVFKSFASAIGLVPFTIFIYLIDILVALLQAYVFTLLSSLFVGMSIHPEH